MLKFIKDTHSIMGLTLSQLGLFLATGILLAAVFSILFSSNWQRTAELQSLAGSFSNLMEDIDTRFFENTATFHFPENGYSYMVQLSSEYIVVSAKGPWGNDLSVKERFLVRPWLRSSDENWSTGQDLHNYLNMTYGHYGTHDDPISAVNITELIEEEHSLSSFFVLHPVEMLPRELVVLEKVTIFYDGEKKHDFLLVYQPL